MKNALINILKALANIGLAFGFLYLLLGYEAAVVGISFALVVVGGVWWINRYVHAVVTEMLAANKAATL